MDGRVTQLVALVVSIAIVGCGSGRHSSSGPGSASTSTTAAQPGGGSVVSTGPVRASLTGENHAPHQGTGWSYRVRVRNASGRALSGTVDIEFAFGGQVVGRDTPPTHPVTHGSWHDRIVFPPASVGQPLTVRAVVHTALGAVTLDWPIKVTP
jgi:hypothetical protein